MQDPNLGPIGQIARSVKDIAAARRCSGHHGAGQGRGPLSAESRLDLYAPL